MKDNSKTKEVWNGYGRGTRTISVVQNDDDGVYLETKGDKMNKTIKRVQMLDKEQLEIIIIKLIKAQRTRNKTITTIDEEFNKSLGEATLKL